MRNTLPLDLTRLRIYFNHYISLKKMDPYDHYAAFWVTLSCAIFNGMKATKDIHLKDVFAFRQSDLYHALS